MNDALKHLLEIGVPILTTGIGIGIQRLWTILISSRYDLRYHKIFTDIAMHISNVEGWNVEGNRLVFKEAFLVLLRVVNEETKKLAGEINRKFIPRQQMALYFIEWFKTVISLYNKEWAEMGISERVRTHLNNKQRDRIERFWDEIREITLDRTYPTNQFVKRAILDILRLVISEMKDEWNEIVYRSEYNGYFYNEYYKGIPINDKQYKFEYKNKLNNNKDENN